MDFPYDNLHFYTDPTFACLAGLVIVALAVWVSIDLLHARRHRRFYPPTCRFCGGVQHANHFCREGDRGHR